mgnify:CR=1 FL=1
MRRIITILFASLLLLTTACVDETEYADNPRGNFEALWRAIDEHYCFFDYKHEQYGLDWDEVHERYSRQIADDMTTGQLFEVLGNMLGELRDGHVNMYSAWDVARNWSWHEDYPSNVSDTLLSKYLGTDYRIAAGLRYRVLDDNTGYIRCATFAYNFGEGNLDNIMLYLAPCNGLIVDLRDNGGGQLTAAEQLAARSPTSDCWWATCSTNGKSAHGVLGDEEPIPEAVERRQMAETGGGADQPRGVQRSQRVREVHALLPERDRRGRPHRRWSGYALLYRTA